MNCLISTSFKLLGMPHSRNNVVTRTKGSVLPGENSRGLPTDCFSGSGRATNLSPLRKRLGDSKLRTPQFGQIPNCSTPDEINFKIIGREVRWSFSRQESLRLLRQVSRIFCATGRRSDIHHVAIARSTMLVFNRMYYIGMPENSVARLHQWNRGKSFDQQTVKLRIHRERTARLRSAEIVFGDIILKSAKQDVHHRLGDWNQLQRAVSLSLASQCSPSLKRPEH